MATKIMEDVNTLVHICATHVDVECPADEHECVTVCGIKRASDWSRLAFASEPPAETPQTWNCRRCFHESFEGWQPGT